MSISTFQRLWRMSLPYVASQYAASDFYPITLCEVCGHAGHSTHNGGCHLWCDILQRFSIAYAYGSHYELFKGLHPHRREWGTGLHSKQIFCSPSSQIWSVGHCKCQIITWCPPPPPHTHFSPSCLSSPGLRNAFGVNNSLPLVSWLKFGCSGPPAWNWCMKIHNDSSVHVSPCNINLFLSISYPICFYLIKHVWLRKKKGSSMVTEYFCTLLLLCWFVKL